MAWALPCLLLVLPGPVCLLRLLSGLLSNVACPFLHRFNQLELFGCSALHKAGKASAAAWAVGAHKKCSTTSAIPHHHCRTWC